MPSRQISDLCLELQPLAGQFLARCNSDPVVREAGAEVFLTCTYRSGAEQDDLYAEGRTIPGVPCRCHGKENTIGSCPAHILGLPVTKARAGQSPHNCKEGANLASKAFDFAIRQRDGTLDWNAADALWSRAVSIGSELGLETGKKWGDSPHMQIRGWKDSRG